jgi:hypothetical protein
VNGGGYLNDLWMYDGVNWTWMSGNSTVNQYGSDGVKGVPDPSNYPGSRSFGISWRDNDGNLWMFGGFGYTMIAPRSTRIGILCSVNYCHNLLY